MIKQLDEFRRILSTVMCKCIHKRIVLYGNGRSGQFIKWYAKYYHNITVDYEIALQESLLVHDSPVLAPHLFDFNYRDVDQCVIWLTEPIDDKLEKRLKDLGLKKDIDYFDFYERVYNGDYFSEEKEVDVFKKKKSGKRDIQFMEWLEWKFDCNLLTAIYGRDLNTKGNHYCITTQREIFPILDLCHFDIGANNAAFDYGCGKGGSIISFFDYGFTKVGGVEYEKNLHAVAKDNMEKLGLPAEIIRADAAEVTRELDAYNVFYFYDPFSEDTFAKCINNIIESLERKPRSVKLILFIPYGFEHVEKSGRFVLKAQTLTCTWLKVVNIYESIPVP